MPNPNMRKLGGGLYRNAKKGSPRYGKRFKMQGGAHVYNPGKPGEVRIGKSVKRSNPGKSKNPGKNAGKNPGRGKGRPNRKQRDQWNPLAPLTGKDLQHEMNAATRLQFGETEQELDYLRRQSQQHETNVGDWWGDYRAQVAAAEQRTRQGYQQAAAGVYAQGAQAAGQDAERGKAIQAGAEKSAELRGGTVDPGLAQQANQAVAARQTSVNTMGGLIAGQGANAGGYLANRTATAAGQRAQARQNELRRRGEIDKERGGLLRKKADFRVDFRNKARESERTYAAIQREFGLDKTKAELDAEIEQKKLRAARREAKADRRKDRRERRDDRSDKRFDRRDENRKFALDRQKFGLDVAQERRMAREGSSGSGGSGAGNYTPTQVRAGRRDLRSAVALAKDTGDAKRGREKVLRQFLASKGFDDPVLGRVAVEYAIYGGVRSKGLRGSFRRNYGFTPRRVKKQSRIGDPVRKGLDFGNLLG